MNNCNNRIKFPIRKRPTNFFLKDVCHIWELGGGPAFHSVLETPLSPSKLPSLHIVLMVDLSKPDELWYTMETTITAIKNLIEKGLAKL